MINFFVSDSLIKNVNSTFNFNCLKQPWERHFEHVLEYQDLTNATKFLDRICSTLNKKQHVQSSSPLLMFNRNTLVTDLLKSRNIYMPIFHGHITSLTGPIDEPDMEELKQNAAYTLLQVLVDTMNDIILKYPDTVPLFQGIFDEILSIKSSAPILSDAEMLRIKELGDVLGNQMVVAELPKDYRLEFRSQVSQAYQDIMAGVLSDIKQISDALTSGTAMQALEAQLHSCMTSLFKYFANLNLLGFASTNLGYGESSDAVALLLSIMKILPKVSSDKQTLVMTALDPLLRSSVVYSGTNAPLYQLLAEAYCYYIAGELGASNPVLLISEVNSAIKSTANALTTSGFTVGPLFQQAMINIADRNGQSVLVPSSSLYSQNADEGINVNFNYIQIIITGDTGTAGVINSLTSGTKDTNANLYTRFLGLWQTAQEDATLTLSKLQTALNQLETYKTANEVDLLQAFSFQMKELPLPSAIAFILLDHYMPQEVKYLEDLTGTLYYNNLGSKIGNALLDGIIDFVNGASYFNFASYAGKQPIVGVKGFPGDVDKAKQKIVTEKDKAVKYLEQCSEGQRIIEEQIKALDTDKIINEFQKNNLLMNLTNYQNSLNAIAADLVSVWSLLSQLTVAEAIDDKNVTVIGMFSVRGPKNWQRQLEDLETALVSGIVGSPIVGGLFTSQAVIQSEQQSFADQGQNDQLDLQMHLTTMQQEWTVVATSLQILNQIYLSLARSVLG